jgi:Type I phosphodiesterase / nucleotide pyrophosphatase
MAQRGKQFGPRDSRLAVLLSCALIGGAGCGLSTPDLSAPGSDGRARTRPSPQRKPPAGSRVTPPPTGHGTPDAKANNGASDARAPAAGADAQVTLAARTPTVIFVSIDGLAPRFIEAELALGRVPGFARLQRQGAFTHRAACEQQSSYTMPNHTSMLTGVPAMLAQNPAAEHGFLINYDPGGEVTLHNHRGGATRYIHSVFDEVHDRGGFTALFAGKSKFELFRRSYSGDNSRPDRLGADNGRDKITAFEVDSDSTRLVDGVAAHPRGPNFVMFHFHDTDTAGHTYGWGSDEYLAALRAADLLLQGLLDSVSKRNPLAGSVVVVTTDHGGSGFGHDDHLDTNIFRIPAYVWGAGVPAADLYRLGSGRTDPAAASEKNSGASEPLRNGDLGNLALWMLGLPPITESTHREFVLNYD